MKKYFIYLFILVTLIIGFSILNKYYLNDKIFGECTTTLKGRSSEQANNIKNVIRKLQNIKLNSGDTFSFNSYIGQCKNESGFEPAPMIVDGIVEESIGGGICQASSTLYNAVLMAGLDIIERHAHSYRINSVPTGYDATVAYGKADLSFKNNFSFPVFIKSDYSRNRITIKIVSRKTQPYKVKMERVVKKTILPPYEKSDKSHGSKYQYVNNINSSKGAIIEIKRLFYKNGHLIKEEVVSTDFYGYKEKII